MRSPDLSIASQTDLDAIAFSLNTRPRKTLGWATLVGLHDGVVHRQFDESEITSVFRCAVICFVDGKVSRKRTQQIAHRVTKP